MAANKTTRWLYRVVPVMLSLLCMYPVPERSATVNFGPVPGRNFRNASIEKAASNDFYYTIADVTYTQGQDPSVIDAVLSFNGPARLLRSDEAGHYKITYSDYITMRGKGELGQGCASFFRKSHHVDIETVPDLWLGMCGDLGSFTIEFRFLPRSLIDGALLFSRVGYFSGSKRGIEILFRNRRIIVVFYDVFEGRSGVRKTVSLTGGDQLDTGEWYHFALSFDRISGKLAKYINGSEDDSLYATEDGTSYSEVLTPSFGERLENGTFRCVDDTVARIGGGYNGFLDEFRISRLSLDSLKSRLPLADKKYRAMEMNGRLPFNSEGLIFSRVYTFPDTGTRVTDFDWDQELPEGTFIWTEFRISDRLFYEDDRDIRWYRVKKGQRNIFLMRDSENNFLRGKYYQWRAHLIASPDGGRAPRLSNLRLSYQADRAPAVPRFLEVMRTGDSFISLRWRKNNDSDLKGYCLYYGVVRGRYDGIIRTVNGKPLTNDFNSGDYVEVIIDNDVIEENRKKDRSRLLDYPMIKNTVLYFLAVTAFDNYRPDTPYSHESGLSGVVTARPFAGSEIR